MGSGRIIDFTNGYFYDSGGGSIIKTGDGELRLGMANTYTGDTTIHGGTLTLTDSGTIDSSPTIVVGDAGSSGAVLQKSSGTFNVGSTQTLKGIGTVSGAVSVSAGGTLAPGDGVGTLTVSGNLTLADGALLNYELGAPASSARISMSADTLTLGGQDWVDFTFTTNAGFDAGVYVLIDAGAINGALGGDDAGIVGGMTGRLSLDGENNDLVLTVTTGLVDRVVETLDPSDDATDVSPFATLAVTFDQNIARGTGAIEIRRTDDGSLFETMDVTSGQVTFNGRQVTIAPASFFDVLTGYYVLIPAGAILGFPGISDPATWNFTTGAEPAIVALDPEDDTAGVPVTNHLVITFDKTVVKGGGAIDIRRTSDDSLIETIDVSSDRVTVDGARVTIDPVGFLEDGGVGYYVRIADGAIVGFAGISDATTWNFTTEVVPPIILYEPFDYGESDIEDVSTLGGDTPGLTSAEKWVNNAGPDARYVAEGLTIGSDDTTLMTAGGRFTVSNDAAQNVAITRGIDCSRVGAIYGSYLWRTSAVRGDRKNISWVGISGSGGNQNVRAGDFAAMAHRWGTSRGGVALDSESANGATLGADWSLDETYLVLFTVTGLGGTGDQTIKLWLLTSDQFDTHKASGGALTEAELDAAAPGTAADGVLQRISLTQTAGSDVTPADFLVLGAFLAHVADFDEIRISGTSLDVATPVTSQALGGVMLIVR